MQNSEQRVEKTDQGIVVLNYEDLVANKDLCASIGEAYGYDGIGLLAVKGVPHFSELRSKLLPLGGKYAALPDPVKAKCEHKASNYSIGWSHGKEILKPGHYDLWKGSYYANPMYDTPTTDEALIREFPESCLPNIWPTEDFPALEPAFKELGRLMIDVGLLVARACDRHVRAVVPQFQGVLMEKYIRESRIPKGRLLHYFPIQEDTVREHDSWCAWHNDHSALTALVPGLFVDVHDLEREIQNPDPQAGLWVRTRHHKELRVPFSRDYLAFQIGETAQIMSGGVLRATPHAVQAVKYPESKTVARTTFAVFMEPNFDVPMELPPGKTLKDAACERYKPGMTFGEFSKVTIAQYYRVD